ncbi:MAG: immunity 17 family protein [Flavobacteriales bacterium]|nr:immunity 17 family protein [Flavobacteriales bacterium]
MSNTILGVLVIGAGVFSLLASLFNWEFFFTNYRARFFVKLFGRQGARIFYSLLALFMFFIAYKIFTSPE